MQYSTGSLIYFLGDPAEKVFLLQTGKVNLKYHDIETGEEVNDLVQPGEFFGVKSAMGRYPREENAIVLVEAAAMAFTVQEFEALATANTRIIMKMLKVFSNQLRKVHKQVSSLMATEEQNPETGLYRIGENYLKKKNFAEARYVFGRYLTYYPSGQYSTEATTKLQQTGIALAKVAPKPEGEPVPIQAPPEEILSDTAKAYYDAVSLMSRQKYQQAYLALKKIIDTKDDEEYVAKSSFELGHCLFQLNKFDECIKFYTVMLSKYPKHPDLCDALFYMGQSYEKSMRKDEAGTIYKKILSIASEDDEGIIIKTKRAFKALEK